MTATTGSQWISTMEVTPSASAARFFAIGASLSSSSNATETTVQIPWAADGKFKQMIVRLTADPAGTASRKVELSVNGTPSAVLVATVASGSTSASVVGDVSITAGDLITYKHTPANTPAAANVHIFIEWLPTTANYYVYPWHSLSLETSAGTIFHPMSPSTNHPGVETVGTIQCPFPLTGTFRQAYVACETAPGGGILRTFQVRKNAGNLGSTFSITDPAKTGSITGQSGAITAGDTINWQETPNSAANSRVGGSVCIESTTANLFAFLSPTSGAAATNEFFAVHSGDGGGNDATEANVQVYFEADLTWTAMYGALSVTPGVAHSRTYVFRESTIGDKTITFAISGNGPTTGNDTSHTDTTTAGHLLSISATNVSPSASSVALSMAVSNTGGPPPTDADVSRLTRHIVRQSVQRSATR